MAKCRFPILGRPSRRRCPSPTRRRCPTRCRRRPRAGRRSRPLRAALHPLLGLPERLPRLRARRRPGLRVRLSRPDRRDPHPLLHGLDAAPSPPWAASLCGACYEVCPVKIDIPSILVHLRGRVVREQKSRLTPEALAMKGMAAAFGTRRRYEAAQRLARLGRARSPRPPSPAGPPCATLRTPQRNLPRLVAAPRAAPGAPALPRGRRRRHRGRGAAGVRPRGGGVGGGGAPPPGRDAPPAPGARRPARGPAPAAQHIGHTPPRAAP